jgi:hypothetical protein
VGEVASPSRFGVTQRRIDVPTFPSVTESTSLFKVSMGSGKGFSATSGGEAAAGFSRGVEASLALESPADGATFADAAAPSGLGSRTVRSRDRTGAEGAEGAAAGGGAIVAGFTDGAGSGAGVGSGAAAGASGCSLRYSTVGNSGRGSAAG